MKKLRKFVKKIVPAAGAFAVIFAAGMYVLNKQGGFFHPILDKAIGITFILLASGMFLSDFGKAVKKVRDDNQKYWLEFVKLLPVFILTYVFVLAVSGMAIRS